MSEFLMASFPHSTFLSDPPPDLVLLARPGLAAGLMASNVASINQENCAGGPGSPAAVGGHCAERQPGHGIQQSPSRLTLPCSI